jgi:hypothetical protein
MKTAILKRLKRLEEVRAIVAGPPVALQIGYLRGLPAEYTGERHVVTVGRDADGKYRWEERRGAPPASEDGPASIIRILLVRAKDGGRTMPGLKMRTNESH